jgi:hypothetical protein
MSHVQVLPLLESVMGPAGPAEVPGAGSVSLGRTQTDRLLRVIPKPASVSLNQLRLAANIAGQDQVCVRVWDVLSGLLVGGDAHPAWIEA